MDRAGMSLREWIEYGGLAIGSIEDLMDEHERLRAAVLAVVTEWDVRGDGGCVKTVQQQLRDVLGECDPVRTQG